MPFLQAFLAAKAAAAREAGVTLTIGENTWVPGRLALPVDVTTVLGNLLDNAIYAARTGANETKVVEVELLQDGSTLHITVADTGDGVAPDFVEHVFTEGKSTKPDSGIPGGRGIGHGAVTTDQPRAGWRHPAVEPGQPGRGAVRRRVHRPTAGRDGGGGSPMGGAELTVLVVDDDFRVANMHAGIVNALPGFTVTTTATTLGRAPARPTPSTWPWSTSICPMGRESTSSANCTATAWF